MMIDKVILGKMIKESRQVKGFTQEQLSEVLEITPVFLSDIERGIKLPSLTTFVKTARILEVSTDSLLSGDLNSGKEHIYNKITSKLEQLTPKQRFACVELIETYIRNL